MYSVASVYVQIFEGSNFVDNQDFLDLLSNQTLCSICTVIVLKIFKDLNFC